VLPNEPPYWLTAAGQSTTSGKTRVRSLQEQGWWPRRRELVKLGCGGNRCGKERSETGAEKDGIPGWV